MRHLICTTLFALLPLTMLAQGRDFVRYRQLYRINLTEKANLQLQALPGILLNAFKEGKLTAYYPNAPEAMLPYGAFLERFQVGRRVSLGQNDMDCCGQTGNYRYNSVNDPDAYTNPKPDPELEAELWGKFKVYMELVEDRTFEQNTSTEKFRTKLVRLVWVPDNQNQVPLNGAIFRYEDIDALELELPNPKNEAAPNPLAQVIVQRMFIGFVTMDGDRFVQSVGESYRLSDRRDQWMANIWNY